MKVKLYLIVGIILWLFISNCASLNSLSTSSQSLNSLSTSLNSISNALNSVSSVSKSLASVSASSASNDDKKSSLYIQDVESLTYLFMIGKIESWEEAVERLAQKYGYLTWKESPHSFIGIGKGLKKANLPEKDFESFSNRFFDKNPHLSKFLKLGYHS